MFVLKTMAELSEDKVSAGWANQSGQYGLSGDIQEQINADEAMFYDDIIDTNKKCIAMRKCTWTINKDVNYSTCFTH